MSGLHDDLARLCDTAINRIAIARSEDKIEAEAAKGLIDGFLDARARVSELTEGPTSAPWERAEA